MTERDKVLEICGLNMRDSALHICIGTACSNCPLKDKITGPCVKYFYSMTEAKCILDAYNLVFKQDIISETDIISLL